MCYIHGSRKKENNKLILGHSYKRSVSDISVKMPKFKNGYKKAMVNAAFDDAKAQGYAGFPALLLDDDRVILDESKLKEIF